MRVLLLADRIPPENRGGAGEVTWRLACGLRQSGDDVYVAAATDGEPFEDERDGIATFHLHSRYPDRWRGYLSLRNPQTTGALRELYQRIKPDVINAHNVHRDLSYHSLTLAHNAGIPAVFSSHDVMPFAYHKLSHFVRADQVGRVDAAAYRLPRSYNLKQMRFRYNPLRNRMIRHILTHHAAARTVPSDELGRAHVANGLPPFETVHNGIEPDRMHAPPDVVSALRDRLQLRDRRVILFAGRLTRAKGTTQLLDALLRVVPDMPDVALLVLSAAPIDEQVSDAKYAELRQKHIFSGGWLSGGELAAAYQLADVVVVPSVVFDTFPTVILEAMSAHTPVIASIFGGAHEAVRDGETGYIINPFDTATFASRLTTLLNDYSLRQKMGQAAFDRLTAHFTLHHQVDAMRTIFERVR